MLDTSTDEIGDGIADQDENDINRDQFHGRCAPKFPRLPTIGRIPRRGEGVVAVKMV